MIVYPKGKNGQRTLLAHALIDISGVAIASTTEALRALDPIPTPLIQRMFIIYRGSLRQSAKFTAASLYKAPEPSSFAKRVNEQSGKLEDSMEKLDAHLESMFGAKEVAEARRTEQLIAQGSVDPKTGVPRGAVRKERGDDEDETTERV